MQWYSKEEVDKVNALAQTASDESKKATSAVARVSSDLSETKTSLGSEITSVISAVNSLTSSNTISPEPTPNGFELSLDGIGSITSITPVAEPVTVTSMPSSGSEKTLYLESGSGSFQWPEGTIVHGTPSDVDAFATLVNIGEQWRVVWNAPDVEAIILNSVATNYTLFGDQTNLPKLSSGEQVPLSDLALEGARGVTGIVRRMDELPYVLGNPDLLDAIHGTTVSASLDNYEQSSVLTILEQHSSYISALQKSAFDSTAGLYSQASPSTVFGHPNRSYPLVDFEADVDGSVKALIATDRIIREVPIIDSFVDSDGSVRVTTYSLIVPDMYGDFINGLPVDLEAWRTDLNSVLTANGKTINQLNQVPQTDYRRVGLAPYFAMVSTVDGTYQGIVDYLYPKNTYSAPGST